jgi:regulator of replication initiation timing
MTERMNQLMAENQNLRFDLDSMRAHEKYHQAQTKMHGIFPDNDMHGDYNKTKHQLEIAQQKIRELEFGHGRKSDANSLETGHLKEKMNEYIQTLSNLQIENEELKRTLKNQNPDFEWNASTTSNHNIRMELNKAINENEYLKSECQNLKLRNRQLEEDLHKTKVRMIQSEDGHGVGNREDVSYKKLKQENDRLMDKLAQAKRDSRNRD